MAALFHVCCGVRSGHFDGSAIRPIADIRTDDQHVCLVHNVLFGSLDEGEYVEAEFPPIGHSGDAPQLSHIGSHA